MAANTTPIFIGTPNVQWSGSMTAANTDTSMATGTSYAVYTASANGSKVEDLYITYLGTLAGATVLRLFVNNGSSTGTAANNTLVTEITVPALTISQTAANTPIVVRLNLVLKANYVLRATLGTAAANGIAVTAVGGDY
jgi:hypothetical protein